MLPSGNTSPSGGCNCCNFITHHLVVKKFPIYFSLHAFTFHKFNFFTLLCRWCWRMFGTRVESVPLLPTRRKRRMRMGQKWWWRSIAPHTSPCRPTSSRVSTGLNSTMSNSNSPRDSHHPSLNSPRELAWANVFLCQNDFCENDSGIFDIYGFDGNFMLPVLHELDKGWQGVRIKYNKETVSKPYELVSCDFFPEMSKSSIIQVAFGNRRAWNFRLSIIHNLSSVIFAAGVLRGWKVIEPSTGWISWGWWMSPSKLVVKASRWTLALSKPLFFTSSPLSHVGTSATLVRYTFFPSNAPLLCAL